MKELTTKEKILKEGRSLLQKHGYNGFSFQDIAERVEIKKPSIYDHFGSKEELVVAILRDYRLLFERWIAGLGDLIAIDKIQKTFDVYYAFCKDKGKVCPILALSIDESELSKNMLTEMNSFIDRWLGWLEEQIKLGQKNGDIRKDIKADLLARFVYAQGIGSQIQARLLDDPNEAIQSGKVIYRLLKS